MKILIITYLNCLSPGTFLQAFGVQVGLKKEFPDAVIHFLNVRNVEKSHASKKSSTTKIEALKQKTFAFIRLMQLHILQRIYFKTAGKKVNLFDCNRPVITNLINGYDIVVIGSDTILEAVYGRNGKQIGIMWPDTNIKIKKVYFAASAAPGNILIDDTLRDTLKTRINTFLFIGLRDDITMNLFRNILGNSDKPLVKQPDPTYFINLSRFKLPFYYRHKLNKIKKLCLFTFNSQFHYRKELSELLKAHGYTLVSAQYIPEADICLATLHPLQWGSIFSYCELVVTERFHDTVFALRYCKPVISIDWDEGRFSKTMESKTNSILKEYELEKYHMVIREKADVYKIEELLNIIVQFNPKNVEKMNEQQSQLANSVLKQIGKIQRM